MDFPSCPARPGLAVALLCAWTLLAAAPTARAWNQAGHLLTASVAYDQLTPAQRAAALKVLEASPDHARWLAAAPKDLTGDDAGRHVFMQAARWPDDIRKTGSPYDHPTWHYVDYPLRPPDFPLEAPPVGAEDVFFAWTKCEATLADPAASATDRAVSLCWLLHLIGDIHQPLHACTLVTAEYPPPAGDKGGNNFFVNLAGNSLSLHTYWDALAATMLDSPEIIARAEELAKRYPRAALPELAAATDLRGWALESRQLGVDAVYRRGTLPGNRDRDGAVPPSLPGDYASKARALAERRVVLAGYRIADTLARLKL